MEIVSNEKINLYILEEKMYKNMMELGINLIKDELKLIDNLIKECRDKELLKNKDTHKTTIKTRLGGIDFFRRKKMEINEYIF